ncbi:MAG: hypothetical protein GY705_20615 [Bacteroidetes bacterium]|nr:hypothetical protein [Bacteroidota bacterium]
MAAAPIDILEPFRTIDPSRLIIQFEDWILFTLLLFLFWAIIGVSLRKRFESSRHLKTLVTVLAFIFAIGTYYAIYKELLHISLVSLGMFGGVLIMIMVFFITYGLIRGYGVKKVTALPLGFVLFYISIYAISPNMGDTLKRIFPAGSSILLLIFIISIFIIVRRFWGQATEKGEWGSKLLEFKKSRNRQDIEIGNEIGDQKVIRKKLTKDDVPITKKEIKTISDIQLNIEQLLSIIKKSGDIFNVQEKERIVSKLRYIFKKEFILIKGMELIKHHVAAYRQLHIKDINGLKERLTKTVDVKRQNLLKEEIFYQRKMINAEGFLGKYESNIIGFRQIFNRFISEALQRMKNSDKRGARYCLEKTYDELRNMEIVYRKQKDLEKYLLKINKKTIRDLQKEKKAG